MSITEAGRYFDFLKRRKVNFQLACNQPAMQEMLISLAEFCRANVTSAMLDKNGKIDVEQTLIMEGRRQVWLFIQANCKLSSQQLYKLLTGEQFNPGENL